MRRASFALIPFVLALSGVGCGYVNEIGPSSCDRSEDSNPALEYDEGEVVNGVYQSSDPEAHAAGGAGGEALTPEEEAQEKKEAELLLFEGGMRYEIIHKLGQVPTWFQVYLSFGRYGAYDGENTLALASGNQAEIIDVTDESMTVINGSCSNYYLLVVAGTGQSAPP